MAFLRIKAKKKEKDIQKSLFCLSESLRSIEIYFFHTYVVDRNDYFLFFMLMSLIEAIIFSFSRLCR